MTETVDYDAALENAVALAYLSDTILPEMTLPSWFTRPGWEKRSHVIGAASDVRDRHNWMAAKLESLGWDVVWAQAPWGAPWARCTPPNHDGCPDSLGDIGSRFD